MTAGSFYNLTVLHVAANGSQDLQVSFTAPDGTIKSPIPNEYLVSYKEGTYVRQSASQFVRQ